MGWRQNIRLRKRQWPIEDVAFYANLTVEELGYPAGAVISRKEARKALMRVWHSSTEPNAFLDMALISVFGPKSRWRNPPRWPDGLYRVIPPD